MEQAETSQKMLPRDLPARLSHAPMGLSGLSFDRINRENHGVLRLGQEISLAKGRIHEVLGDSAESFAMAVAASLTGPVFWIGERDDISSLAPTGVQTFLDPARLVLVEGVSRDEVLWAGEQALNAQGGFCVVIELRAGPDLKTSRRLQIACEASGALGIILIKNNAHNSACETRWHCAPCPGGDYTWRWACVKNKRGHMQSWKAQWRPDAINNSDNDETKGGEKGAGCIHLAATAAA